MDRIEKIIIRKTVSPEDYRKVVYFNVLFRSRLQFALYAVVAVFSVAEIIRSLLTGIGGNLITFLLAVLALGFIAFIFWKTEKTARRVVRESADLLGQTRTVIFSEENVVVEGREQGQFDTLEWDTLSKAYELKDYFIVYFTLPKTITIPKSAMDYDKMREMSKMLQKKCKNNNYINRAK